MSANIEVVQMDVTELSQILLECESELDDTTSPQAAVRSTPDEAVREDLKPPSTGSLL